jgi:hypothetical protein
MEHKLLKEKLIVSLPNVQFTNKTPWDAIYGDPYDNKELGIVLDRKVDKVEGKELSDNNFDDNYKEKLDNIEANAEVNVQSNWDETDTTNDAFIQNKPDIYVATWGKIGGDIDNQTDLIDYINNAIIDATEEINNDYNI